MVKTNSWGAVSRGTTNPNPINPLLHLQNSANLNRPQNTENGEELTDPSLEPVAGSHVLVNDAMPEINTNLIAQLNLNLWVGYHQQSAFNSFNSSAFWGAAGRVGTPQYYKVRDTAAYSPTMSLCIGIIVETATGNGLDFVGKNKANTPNPQNEKYVKALVDILPKALQSLIIFGEAFVYQNEAGVLDFWNLDILRLNTEGGLQAKKAGIIACNLTATSWDTQPHTIAPIHPNINPQIAGYQTVYRLRNKKSTRHLWAESENLAIYHLGEEEYLKNVARRMPFKKGIPPAWLIILNGETAGSDEFLGTARSIKKQSTGSKSFGSTMLIPGESVDAKTLANTEPPAFSPHSADIRNDIIANYRLTPALAGFSTAGKLGSSQERNAEYVNFVQNVIKPYRKQLETTLIYPYFTYCDTYLGTNLLEEYNGFLETNNLILIDQINVQDVLTINESRIELGYAPSKSPYADIPMGLLKIMLTAAEIQSITDTASGLTDTDLEPQSA